MPQRKKIAVIFGTRPDTIKLAPIILELQKDRKHFDVVNIATAQHMRPRQTLATLTKNTIAALDEVLEKEKPDMVLVQGDTTTTMVGGLAAFYRRIPVGHVEAGLRTYDKANPFPEEINRMITSVITELHFAPTNTARAALRKENVPTSKIFVTGNSVIDALKLAVKKDHRFSMDKLNRVVREDKKVVLLTMHRRENWGEPMRSACRAVKRLSQAYPDLRFVFPVHLNPLVRDVVNPILRDQPNVHLIEPLDYRDFVNFMAISHLILTDSGGVQEEAPAFGKPVLVLRNATERPEAVKSGTVKLVGLDENTIFATAKKLLDDARAYRRMASATNPYGDGLAAKRTVAVIRKFFGLSKFLPSDFSPKQ
jgi:UDP-N-acetylglucosamine 2-epimerase (non-hydrolysing)